MPPQTLAEVARTERYSTARATLLKAALKIPLTEFYWNGQLKKNGAWDRRFATPYATKSE